MKRVFLSTLGILFLLGVFFSLAFGLFLVRPAWEGAPSQTVVIRENAPFKEVAGQLEERRIISSRRLFEIWAKITGKTRKIRSGEYCLSPGMTPVQVLDALTRGLVITHSVTIPEGYTTRQIADLLESRTLIKKEDFLAFTRDPAILKRYGICGESAEGYLFPETYRFARGISAPSILEAMLEAFQKGVETYREEMDRCGMSLREIVTLASLVEKETGSAEERPLIASVFLNRLDRGMRLASDPTVIYGLEDFSGNLTRKHLKTPTPYNTYVIKGLPPGPIANPGIESIKAVLRPAKTDYLYFVSKNDGSHHFSKTLSEHNRAVRLYQKTRKRKTSR